MEQQSFLYSNTHYSDTHYLHNDAPLSTEWKLGIPSNRPSGFEEYSSLGHTPYYGQTTLDMYNPGGVMDKPSYLSNNYDYNYYNNNLNCNNFNLGANNW